MIHLDAFRDLNKLNLFFMKKISLKTVIVIGILIIIFFLIITYINLFVTEKYETQLEGLNATIEQINKASELKSKIDFQKKIIPFLIIVLVASIIPICLIKKK